MDQPSETLQVVRQVAKALTDLGIPYAVGGSMASSVHGVPRFTQDADLMVEPFSGREQALAACFGPNYYLSPPTIAEANRHRRSFNIISIPTGFKVDLFVRKDRPFDIEAMRRRIFARLPDAPDQTLAMLSAEDCILFKLEWYRSGGGISDRQWSDVLGILRVQAGMLEIPYLRLWAEELGIEELLVRAIEEVSNPS